MCANRSRTTPHLPIPTHRAPTHGPDKLRRRLSLEIADLGEATALIVERHYLHRARTMAQIPYWITIDTVRAGVLLFALPRLSVRYQGHGPMNLIELARLWIEPDRQRRHAKDSRGREHAPSIASCAIAKALRRIRQDWHGKYPHLPLIEACVSWSDDHYHEGTIYRAANFEMIGKSGGSLHGGTRRANGGREQPNADYRHIKTAFIYRYRRKLTQTEKARARTQWDGMRPRRHRRSEKPEQSERQLALRLE